MADYSLESKDRIEKIKKLKNAGVIVYANNYHGKIDINEITKNTENLKEVEDLQNAGAESKYKTAGRLMSYKSHGKLAFAKIMDHTSSIQVCFMKDKFKFNTGKEVVDSLVIDGEEKSAYKISEKFINVGDYIGVVGDLFYTKHGELTIFIKEFQILSKAVRPLPEKFHGVQDEETIYRQRYLDLITNDESYNRFRIRSKFVKTLRDFYDKNEFIEIETPVLGNAASGAAAAPFITHHNDFDEEFFLRISPETFLKRATVGRFERVVEFTRNFRNEGSDPSHMQEFSAIEHYSAWWNFEDNMRFTEEMFDYVFENIPQLKKEVTVKDKAGNQKLVNFKTPWQRIDYVEGVKNACGIDVSKYFIGDEKKLIADIKAAGVEFEGMGKMVVPTLIDYLYKKVLRPSIVGPAFVYNYPKTMQPLARQNDDNNEIVEQFQVVVNGWEIVKAYSELVDPEIQKANFDAQAVAKDMGDEEATSGDDDFVLAMEYAMPPQSGWGMGIERVLSLLTGQDNLRDVVLFPLMKSEKNNKGEKEIIKKEKNIEAGNEDEYSTLELPSLEEAMKLVDKYSTNTKNHLISVGYVMRYFAEKLGQNPLAWQLVGLLHDIDRDLIEKDSERHCKDDLEKIVGEINLPSSLTDDIKSHGYWLTGVEPNSLIRKYICSTDELTGFIVAISKMMPGKTVDEVKVSSVIKKIKDKSFAAGVDRKEVLNCETMLNIPKEEFIEDVLNALRIYKTHFE